MLIQIDSKYTLLSIKRKEKMFTKIKTKMQNMTWRDWLQTGLWSSVLVFLLAFVIAAATLTKNQTNKIKVDEHKVALAEISTDKDLAAFDKRVQAAKPADVLNALDAKSTIATPKYKKVESTVTEDGTKAYTAKTSKTAVWTTPAHDVYKVTTLSSYDNALAALGLVFTAAIFASLATTVGVKYVERKRGNK